MSSNETRNTMQKESGGMPMISTIQINNQPESDELWNGIGGHFDSLGQIINEFLDNSISNFVGNDVEIRNIRLTLEELEKGQVKVTIEDTGTGILDLDRAFKLGCTEAGESPLNEHGFGLKHAMASANPSNDSWAVFTRTTKDCELNQYKRIGAPYKICDYEAEVLPAVDWPGSLTGGTGTICQFICEKDMFQTLSRGVCGRAKAFRTLADMLFEDIGFTYSGIITTGKANITMRLKMLNGETFSKPIGAVEPEIIKETGPEHGEEIVNLGGGKVTIKYTFGKLGEKEERREFDNSTVRKYYRKKMSSSGVEIRINGRVLCYNLFSEIWGIEKHNSYNSQIVLINLLSDDKNALPATRTSKNGLREGDPKLKELFSWIRTKCKTPERDTKESQDEVEIFAALKDIKLKQIPDDNKVVSTEVKAFTTTGETRDRVRIDLYEYALGQLTIYEGKKHITSSKDVYQLRMYWDGLVFDGIKPKRGILIARQHPESVKTLIRIVNSMQDANGNNYNFITKTWDDEGVPV